MSSGCSHPPRRTAGAPPFVSSRPCRPCCFGPSCSKEGTTLCSGCQSASYCGTGCQRADWKQGHKLECKQTAKAAFELCLSAAAGSTGWERALYLFNLGLACKDGRGVQQSDARAISYWRKAAALGCAQACTNLACGYGDGLWGLAQDWGRAHFYFLLAAAGGDVLAMHNLHDRYRNGQGCAQSHATAISWLRRALEDERAAESPLFETSAFTYAVELWNGSHVPQDKLEARRWLAAAAPSVPQAALMYGNCLRDGPGPQDHKEAYKMFQLAAQAGLQDAYVNLGVHLMNGQGCARNEVEALRWYEKAAAMGDANGLSNLGNAWRDGRGGRARDVVGAVSYYERAAALGHAQAAFAAAMLLEDCPELGALEERTRRKLKLLKQASEGGFPLARLVMGAGTEAELRALAEQIKGGPRSR